MRSRAGRLTFVTLAWIALVAAGIFSFNLQKTVGTRADALRALDLHAREASDAVAELRVAQHSYVAAGQGVEFWMPKVAATEKTAAAALTALRDAATIETARTAVDDAAAAMK